jgi:peptide/nickel transport system substrate-binding protein
MLGVAGCGGNSTTSSASGSPATGSAGGSGTPRSGGTLRVGSLGSTGDTLDTKIAHTDMDLQRMFCLYDTLTYFNNKNFELQMGLAESIEMSQGATVATIRVRDGVTFHNGKSLTADDVIATFRRMLDPANPGTSAKNISMVNPDKMEKLDGRTVRFTLNYADSLFPERLYVPQLSMLPADYDPAKPVGSGPFMFKSFTPGQQSVFVKNPNYWVSGKPYLDQLVITDFGDDSSKINALLSGQLDAIDSVPLNNTSTIEGKSNLKLLNANGGFIQPIVMNVSKAPWNDPKVRQAMRLLVNRKQMISQGYNGFGSIGNDVPCTTDPAYPHDLAQREQDIDQAKSLLKSAGHEGLTADFVTAEESAGLTSTAQVFVQNAKQAGVTLNLKVIQNSVYDPQFKEWPFTQGYYGNKPLGIMIAFRYIKGGNLNDTNWDDQQTETLYRDALKETDAAKRNEKFTAIAKILYDSGGDIIHSFRNTVDAYGSKFHGFAPSQSTGWSLGQYRYSDVWQE